MPVVKKVRLPRLPIGWDKQPQLFERYWDEAMTGIEYNFDQILAIPGIQAAIDAANAAAAAANAAAGNAQAVADTSAAENSLVNSYIDSASFVVPLLSADPGGNITVKTHMRVYGDSVLNPSASVTGAVVASGAAIGSTVRIYYNDATRTGGAVTYLFTVDPAPPPVQSGNTHSVGVVTIPAAGTNDGKNIQPPGYVEA